MDQIFFILIHFKSVKLDFESILVNLRISQTSQAQYESNLKSRQKFLRENCS